MSHRYGKKNTKDEHIVEYTHEELNTPIEEVVIEGIPRSSFSEIEAYCQAVDDEAVKSLIEKGIITRTEGKAKVLFPWIVIRVLEGDVLKMIRISPDGARLLIAQLEASLRGESD